MLHAMLSVMQLKIICSFPFGKSRSNYRSFPCTEHSLALLPIDTHSPPRSSLLSDFSESAKTPGTFVGAETIEYSLESGLWDTSWTNPAENSHEPAALRSNLPLTSTLRTHHTLPGREYCSFPLLTSPRRARGSGPATSPRSCSPLRRARETSARSVDDE